MPRFRNHILITHAMPIQIETDEQYVSQSLAIPSHYINCETLEALHAPIDIESQPSFERYVSDTNNIVSPESSEQVNESLVDSLADVDECASVLESDSIENTLRSNPKYLNPLALTSVLQEMTAFWPSKIVLDPENDTMNAQPYSTENEISLKLLPVHSSPKCFADMLDRI